MVVRLLSLAAVALAAAVLVAVVDLAEGFSAANLEQPPATAASAVVQLDQPAKIPYYLTASMPEELADWAGCDDTTWEEFPPGGRKDLLRFVKHGKQELATNRIATLKEILQFVHDKGTGGPGDPWEVDNWETGMSAWEANNVLLKEQEKQRIKKERAEKRRIAAAKKAAEKAAKEAVAKEDEACQVGDNDFQ